MRITDGINASVASGVRFSNGMLYIVLTDGREIGVPLSRFPWLARATPAQRRKWHIEPRGYAVYWDALDDGIEVDIFSIDRGCAGQMMLDFRGDRESTVALKEAAAVINTVREKLKDLAAGKMGYSTTQVGGLVAGAV